MKTSVKDAEKVFNEALALLEGDLPEPSDDCEYCRWASESRPKGGLRQMRLD
jgi:hypothetical protein